jgi:hypothetical protein
MAFSRRLGVVGLLGVSWLLAVGCGDDGDKLKNAGDAGEAGEAPTGGKSTSGGSSNNAGTGGMSTGGNGGSSNAGMNAAAGTGGEAGGAGAGGTAEAGAGGAAGAGGQGGAAGAGGTPEPTLKSCSNQCEIDADCKIDGSDQLTCDQGSHRCVDVTVATCAVSDDCVVSMNPWTTCTTSADCDPDFERCATWQGAGYCMQLHIDDCNFGDVPATLAEFGKADSPVDVCYTAAACKDKECMPGCELIGCGTGDGETCSDLTHLCECTLPAECTSGICGADHACKQCATSDDCAGGISGQDTCVNGACGCSSAAACPDLTDAGVPVCE